MGRLLIGAALQAMLLAPALAAASDFDAVIDRRGVAADGERSFLNSGLGKLRFDPQHDGLRLGSGWIGYRHDFFEIVHFTANALAYADHDRSPLDLTEF